MSRPWSHCPFRRRKNFDKRVRRSKPKIAHAPASVNRMIGRNGRIWEREVTVIAATAIDNNQAITPVLNLRQNINLVHSIQNLLLFKIRKCLKKRKGLPRKTVSGLHGFHDRESKRFWSRRPLTRLPFDPREYGYEQHDHDRYDCDRDSCDVTLGLLRETP